MSHRKLDDETLDLVLSAARIGDFDTVMHQVWLAYGFDLTSEDCPRFKAMDHSLDHDQWHAICKALGEGTDVVNRRPDTHVMARVNLMMDWVNVSPSGAEGEA